MKKTNLWIDTDMGNDDIMAIAMLLQQPEIKLQALSLVNGVSSVQKGLINIQSILNFWDTEVALFRDIAISVYPYRLKFPKQDINRAEELTLLKSLSIKKVNQAKADDILNLLEKLPNESTLLALGPLTNIANLIQSQPDLFKQKVSQIVLMGGGIKKGNVPPLRVAEYNIVLDPGSAKIVFDSGISIRMIGIDATSQVPCSSEFREAIRVLKPTNKPATVLKEVIINNDNDFDDFYDPLAVAVLIDTSLILESITQGIDVTTKGKEVGRTVLKQGNNVLIPIRINTQSFYQLLTSLVKGELP